MRAVWIPVANLMNGDVLRHSAACRLLQAGCLQATHIV